MSKEMLPIKLTGDQSLVTEPSIVTERNKDKKRRGGLTVCLLAVTIGAVALTSITLLAPAAFYNNIKSSSSIGDSGYAAAIPTDMAASLKATDGKGRVIEDNGVTDSDEMTITGYSDSSYSTKLSCLLNNLQHAYCSGDDPVTLSGLPPGEYNFTVVRPLSDKTTVHSFSWYISE